MKKANKRKLIISIISFVISFTTSFILGLRLKKDLDAIPTKEEEYLSNY